MCDDWEGRDERRALEREITDLTDKLATVLRHVDGLPYHPWIPGANFDAELREALGL